MLRPLSNKRKQVAYQAPPNLLVARSKHQALTLGIFRQAPLGTRFLYQTPDSLETTSMCSPGALYHSEAPLSGRTAVSVTRRHAIRVKHTSGEPPADWHPVCRCPFDRPPVSYAMSLFVGPTIVVRSPHGRANVPGSISMDPTITSR